MGDRGEGHSLEECRERECRGGGRGARRGSVSTTNRSESLARYLQEAMASDAHDCEVYEAHGKGDTTA